MSIPVPDPNDPVEKEFCKIAAEDDAAVEEIEKWSDAAGAAGLAGDSAGATSAALPRQGTPGRR